MLLKLSKARVFIQNILNNYFKLIKFNFYKICIYLCNLKYEIN